MSEIPDNSSIWKDEIIKTETRLKLLSNTVTCHQFEILQEQQTFFETLYKLQNSQDNLLESDLFNLENIDPLDDNEQILCEGIISEEEC